MNPTKQSSPSAVDRREFLSRVALGAAASVTAGKLFASGDRAKANVHDQDWSDVVHWAKAQANRSNDSVSCKDCDQDGSNVRGDAFDVLLPAEVTGDPSVFKNDVIGYARTANDDGSLCRVCVTPYLDDKIGSLAAWTGAIEDIPRGWRLFKGVVLMDGQESVKDAGLEAVCIIERFE